MEPVPTGVVRLLHAIKIPSGCRKMVRAKVGRHGKEDLALFTPYTLECGTIIPHGALEPEGRNSITLVIENHGTETV